MTSQEAANRVTKFSEDFGSFIEELDADIEGGADDWQQSAFSEGASIRQSLLDYAEHLQKVADGTGIADSAEEVDL